MSYPENVRKMSAQDFIYNLDLEFYISNKSQQMSLANFLVDLAAGVAKKKLIVFCGDGKSKLITKIEKLFGENKNWFNDHPVTKDYYSLQHNINNCSSTFINQYNSPLLISHILFGTDNINVCVDKLLQEEPIQYRTRQVFNKNDPFGGWTNIKEAVYTRCNIILKCNALLLDNKLSNRAIIIEFPYNMTEQIEKINELATTTLDNFLIQDINKIIMKYNKE